MGARTYTDEEAQIAKKMRATGASWKEVSRRLGRSADCWKAFMVRYDRRVDRTERVRRVKYDAEERKEAYRRGWTAARNGLPAESPYAKMTGLWAHWMAGWNDWNITVN